MIVVDASVVVASLLSAGGAGARARERLRLDPDLHVPHLLDVEVTAALRRRVRLGQTGVALATDALADLADLPALRWDHEPLLSRVWELRDNPQRLGKPLRAPFSGHWVARRSSYRVRYRIDEDRHVITILDIRGRADAYRP